MSLYPIALSEEMLSRLAQSAKELRSADATAATKAPPADSDAAPLHLPSAVPSALPAAQLSLPAFLLQMSPRFR